MTQISNSQWLGRLKNLECRDSTYHPHDNALVFARGQGSTVWDVEGRPYIDLCAGFGVLAHGHNPDFLKPIMANVDNFVTHGMGDVYPSTDKIRLLAKLAELIPMSEPRVSLGLSGSQAVEIALKTAMLHTRRVGIIAFEGAYHGLDLGVLPTTWRQDFRAPFEKWMKTSQVVFAPWNCSVAELQFYHQQLRERGSDVAAVLVEPVQGRAGIRPPRSEFLSDLRKFCDETSSCLIYDEVMTGLGRTGRWSHAESTPCDILCLGKSLGAGLPLSACIAPKRIMDAWPESQGEAIHTGTFFGHPLACRAGLAAIENAIKTGLPARSLELGSMLLQHMSPWIDVYPQLKSVRGSGLMLALEFNTAGAGATMMDRLRKKGVIALAAGSEGQCLSLTPALNIEKELLYAGISTIESEIKNLPH